MKKQRSVERQGFSSPLSHALSQAIETPEFGSLTAVLAGLQSATESGTWAPRQILLPSLSRLCLWTGSFRQRMQKSIGVSHKDGSFDLRNQITRLNPSETLRA